MGPVIHFLTSLKEGGTSPHIFSPLSIDYTEKKGGGDHEKLFEKNLAGLRGHHGGRGLPCFGNTPLGSGRFFPLALLTALLGAALIVFTFFPPDNILFFDLSGVWSWVTLPC